MERVPAKVLEPADLRLLLERVKEQRHPHRNTVLILLSFKAGLRACEIAGLRWSMVLRCDGSLSENLTISRYIAKGQSPRQLPMHVQLRRALGRLHAQQLRPTTGHVVTSERGDGMTPASVSNWFARLYKDVGLSGCSSHSGRRTFITSSARVLARTGGSLRDIQELAGHRSLSTTERYIQGSRDAQRRLISLL